jgi:SAM-dependent methyltransferase
LPSSLSARERWLVANIMGNRVLDIGFAGQKGLLPSYYGHLKTTRPDMRLIGLDFDQAAVFARAQSGSVIGDAGRLPFGDGSLDCVVMGEFLEHHVAIEAFLGEAHRVLHPGGRLLVTTPNPYFVNRFIRRWIFPPSADLVGARNVALAMGYHDHRSWWDPLSLAHLLTRSGLRVESIRALGTWIPGLGRLIPAFKRGMLIDLWPANRLGYITCIRATKSRTTEMRAS